MHKHKYALAILIFFISTSSLLANDFIGEWKVVKVIYSDSYVGEIKYPKLFKIEKKNGNISGRYKDQFDYENKFELAVLINNGHELLLSNCCGTKHPESWSPLHKVKIINGKLHAIVVTDHIEFEWIAERKMNH